MDRMRRLAPHAYPSYTEQRPDPTSSSSVTHPNYDHIEARARATSSSCPETSAPEMGVDRVKRTEGSSDQLGPVAGDQDVEAVTDLVRSAHDPDERATLRNAALSLVRTGDKLKQERGSLMLKHLIKSAQDPQERATLRHAAVSIGDAHGALMLKRLINSATDPTELSRLRAELRSVAVHLPAGTGSSFLQKLAEEPVDRAERAALLQATMSLPASVMKFPLERLADSVKDPQEFKELHHLARSLPDGAGALPLLRLVQAYEIVAPGKVATDPSRVALDPKQAKALRRDTRKAAQDMAPEQGAGSVILDELLDATETDDEDELNEIYAALDPEWENTASHQPSEPRTGFTGVLPIISGRIHYPPD